MNTEEKSYLVKEDYYYNVFFDFDCPVCGISSFSHTHKKGTLPRDFEKGGAEITSEEDLWSCKKHNTAGNADMGCPHCYREESAPSMSIENVPVKRGISIEEAKKLMDEFEEIGTHGHTDDLMFSYREVWRLVLSASFLAASEQREKIKKAFQPLCCHVTGMHDPTHFKKDPKRLCDIQRDRAFTQGCKEFGISYDQALSDPNCGWCKDSQQTISSKKE